ncbi:hypothetical protein L1D44_21320 [Shewanella sp. Isolate13]|uniref:hypothetical protein n=1 Tax=Shewanella sp. Isolate13 TaxID=2908531 RepID=UPI001EFD1405|nr:hypothetical protein [Shewanella sp. Isolate13]MCG9732324.1 hypothetical protein [Shewanella sp. Isolate13]
MNKYTESMYWEDANYIRWSKDMFTSLALSIGDIRALSDMGIPEWVAPNLNFDNYESENTRLKLGEDREDRDIFLCFDAYNILIGEDSQFMNSSAFHMRKSLQLYAVMVEEALLIDGESIIKNKVDNLVIDEFEKQLFTLDPPSTFEGSFWFTELLRLKSRNRD